MRQSVLNLCDQNANMCVLPRFVNAAAVYFSAENKKGGIHMKKIYCTLLLLLILALSACGAKPTVTSIQVQAENAKYWYLSGQEIDPSGLVITAAFSDGTTKEIPAEECSFQKPPFMPCGEKEVVVSYGELTASYPIYACPSVAETDDYFTYLIRTNENGSRVSLTPVLLGEKEPFVMIFPGGGYQACQPYGNEGYAYAAELKNAGYNSFILEYSVNMEHPAPLDDVNTAMDIILDNLDFFGVPADAYAVMGSSAGGHLAATWCTKEVGFQQYGKPAPKVLLLSYAATHIFADSRPNLVGENASEERRRSLSADEHVDSDFPATYQWVFDEDELGVAAHTVLMDAALEEAGVDHITHIYPGSSHGVGLAKGLSAEGWIDEAIEFLNAHI